MLSIIIPTLNEEKNIGNLLDCILKQNTGKEAEIIVVDCKSEDSTRKIVEEYQKNNNRIKLVISDVRNVSYQRNLGAKNASNERILFLDADVCLPEGFLEKNLEEIDKWCLGTAGCYVEPISNKLIDKINHSFLNIWLWMMQKIYPHMPGFCIFSTKTIHEKLNGFDNTIKLAEDNDYVNRSKKIAKFKMLDSKKIMCSVRRFKKEGYFTTAIKYLLCPIYRILFGEIRSDIFKYRFGHYEKK